VRAVNLASTFCQLSSAQFLISRFGLFSRLSRFGRLHLAISVQLSARNSATRNVSVSPRLRLSPSVFLFLQIRNPKSAIESGCIL
jgi:hypothetical protein